ncbi:MAG: carboxypeptidase-like regulatory domain-containing protein, partial [Syntrophomonas sp.]
MRTAMRMKKYVHFIICLIFMAMTMLGIPPNVQAQSTLAPTTELSDTTPQQVWRIHIHKDGVLTRSIIDQTDSKSTSKDINSKTVDRSDYGQQNSYRIMEVTGGSISGKVLDENGQTVANAVVYAYTQDYDIYVSAYTDATGCYTISNLPSATYTVTVDAQGWLEEDYPVDVSVTDSQDTGNINFNLKKGGTISGLVLDDNGQAVNNVRVYAYTQDYDIYKSAFTDATGCYTISDLPSGIYTVTVNAEGWLEEDYPGDVSVTDSQDTRNINFNLKKGGTISGQVLDDNGQAANNIRVNVHSKDYSIYESAYTDATGCYTISDLPSGIYIVTVDTDGWVKEDYPSNVNVTAPENTGNINFSLEKGGSISGQVLDENGQALQNIWISAHTLDYDFYDSISTTATGHYTIPNLPSKTYEVTVNADKWVSQDYPSYINVTVLQETGNVNFNLEKGGSISGQVLDGNGQPVNHAWVEAENSDYSIYESSDTDEEGHYVIPNLPGGLYKIRVDAEGWANKVYADNISVTALSHTASTNLVLEPGGSISGRVVDSQGVPVNNISMWANSENGESWNAAETNANGEYTISDLASGVYDVEVDEEDGNGFARIYKSDISVSVSNDTPNINFNLVPAGSISGRIVNSQGNPILDGWVWAESTASGSYNGAHTDANGDYCITNLASGSYEVTARAEGWQRQQYAGNVNVTASNETPNINHTLQRGSATVAAVSDIPDFHINSGTPVNDLGLP